MLSARLLHLIESNWDEIAARLIRAIRRHPDMSNLAARPEIELREWCRDVLRNLNQALTGSGEGDWKERFEIYGHVRFEENIPLHEAVLRAHGLKNQIFAYLAEQGLPSTALNLYAEEELERRLGRFFDSMVYHLVLGYEDAQRVAARVTAWGGSSGTP
jgi:hypothetical protein